jgi:DHA3 family macrolide efflux protein-like MFS transporter
MWITFFTLAASAPLLVTSLVGGVLADKHNRKYLIMLSDGFSALSTVILIVFFLAGGRSLTVVLALSILRSAGNGLQMPAVTALYPQLVETEKLTRIQGINQSVSSVLMLLSPAVGGLLLGSVGLIGSFFIDIATASSAILVMATIKIERVPSETKQESIFKELRKGMRFIASEKMLLKLMYFYSISIFLVTPAAVLTPLMVRRSFGDAVWMLTANEIVWTLGMLFGGVFVSVKGKFADKLRTSAISVICFGILFALLGVAPNFPIYLAFIGLSGIFMPILNTAGTVYIQERVQADMLGKVFSLIIFIGNAAMPVAILLFGPMSDVVRIEHILIVTGALLVAVGCVFIASVSRRTTEH